MAFTVIIRVIPKSGRSFCMLDKANRLRCYLKSPPEQGKANKELLSRIAKALGVSQHMVAILMGATTRIKTIRVTSNHTYAALLERLGIENQQQVFDA
jgi:uncharacterized protein (TIGR00251 family)